VGAHTALLAAHPALALPLLFATMPKRNPRDKTRSRRRKPRRRRSVLDPPGISSEEISTRPSSTSTTTNTTNQIPTDRSQRKETKRNDAKAATLPSHKATPTPKKCHTSKVDSATRQPPAATKRSDQKPTTAITNNQQKSNDRSISSGKLHQTSKCTASISSDESDSSDMAKCPTPSARKSSMKAQASHDRIHSAKKLSDNSTSIEAQRRGARHFTFDEQYDEIKLRLANAKKRSGSTSIIKAHVPS
jgi:hypothetical protein